MLARVHFVVRLDAGSRVDIDRDELERRLVVATRTWQDDFDDALAARFGDDADAALPRATHDVFPEAYKEDFAAKVSVDLINSKPLARDELEPELYEPADTHACDLALKLYRHGPPVSLSHLLPMLQSMGVEVTDERPYEIGSRRRRNARLGVRLRVAAPPGRRRARPTPCTTDFTTRSWPRGRGTPKSTASRRSCSRLA